MKALPRGSGKTWVLAQELAHRLLDVPSGGTVIVHACGCQSLLTHEACMAAISSGGLYPAVLGALTKHQCPTENRAILVPHE